MYNELQSCSEFYSTYFAVFKVYKSLKKSFTIRGGGHQKFDFFKLTYYDSNQRPHCRELNGHSKTAFNLNLGTTVQKI